MRARVAWSLFALTVVVSVVHVVLLVASSEPLLSTAVIGEGFPLVTIGAIAGAGVGALIVSRYPAHPLGWLFVVGQLLSEVGLAVGAYGHSALSGELGEAPGGHVALWLSIHFGGLFVVALLAVVFLLAPDGHLISGRWRWALVLVVAGLVASHVAVATVPPSRIDADGQLVGQAPPLLNALLVFASLAVAVGVLAGAAAVVVRLRRASGDARQQLRWVALAAGLLAVSVVVNVVLVVSGAPAWFESVPVMAAYACLPVFVGIAILRHGLFDIDVIINRAIVLTVLTALVTLGYVGVVVLLSELAPVEHDTYWLPFLATVVIALVFQPVRDGAQRLADRVVYGSRAAPYLQLAEFSKRLQGATGTQEMLRQMADAVAAAVGARDARIVVDPMSDLGAGRSADAGGPTTTVPVIEGSEQLATVEVTMPPGRPLRVEERRLLDDFAVQLGTAFGNLRLESTLTDRVADLSESTRALEASAHRLRLAHETERQRFEDDLRRTVVPHLRDVEAGLAAVLDLRPDAASDAAVGTRLEALAASTYSALDALRTLTRGVFPAQLARQGLVPALTSYLDRSGKGAVLTMLSGERFDPGVESCAYFCVVELVRAVDTSVDVTLAARPNGSLVVDLRTAASVDLTGAAEHLEDRVAALGGRLAIWHEHGLARMSLELPSSVTDDADLLPHPSQ